MMKAWWWGPNFGDLLTPWILEQFGVSIEWCEPREAELFGVGSILHRVPSRFEGYIWGTGKMFNGNPHLTCDHDIDLGAAKVLALRGKITLQELSERYPLADQPVLGDTGLLVRQFLTQERAPDFDIGVLPHFDDHRLASVWPDGIKIDPMSGPDTVLPAIANCKRLVTSSLHGVVVADALGMDSMWCPYLPSADHAEKFHDYASVWEEGIKPMVWRKANPTQVQYKVEELMTTTEELFSGDV